MRETRWCRLHPLRSQAVRQACNLMMSSARSDTDVPLTYQIAAFGSLELHLVLVGTVFILLLCEYVDTCDASRVRSCTFLRPEIRLRRPLDEQKHGNALPPSVLYLPSVLRVPILIQPLNQITAQPVLFSVLQSIDQTCPLGQWSLKGSGVACPTDRSARMQRASCEVKQATHSRSWISASQQGERKLL